MQPAPDPSETRATTRGPVAPTLAVALTVVATCLAVGVPMTVWGRTQIGSRQFLPSHRLPNEFEIFGSYCMEYAQQSREANDVLFLGDSSCRCDVDPVRFGERTGLRAYNLGSLGVLKIEGNLLILRQYLKHHPAPRVIVYCVVPQAANAAAEWITPPFARDIRPRFLWSFDEGSDARPPEPGSLLDLCRRGIREVYGTAVGGADAFANTPAPLMGSMTPRAVKAALDQRRGFWPFPNPKPFSPPATDPPDPFGVDPSFDAGLTRMAALASGAGAKLLVRFAPYSGTADSSAKLRTWADSVEARFPGTVRVGRPEVLRFDPSLFGDEHHCNAAGVERFTDLVADEVRTQIPGR